MASRHAWIISTLPGFSVEAETLLRRKQGLGESLFITFGDQCVFLWQRADCWDTWDPTHAPHIAIILPAILTAVEMEAQHAPWWGEVSNKLIDWPTPIALCCELNWQGRPFWRLYQKASLSTENISFNGVTFGWSSNLSTKNRLQSNHVCECNCGKKGSIRMSPAWIGKV